MFIYNANAPQSMRHAIIDAKHPEGKKILSAARQAARERLDGECDGPGRRRLQKLLGKLDTGQLNHLAVMLMISDKYCGATGQGGIWAAASEAVNDAARAALRGRPKFELIDCGATEEEVVTA